MTTAFSHPPQSLLRAPLLQYVEKLQPEVSKISPERREILQDLAGQIAEAAKDKQECRLVFICTHNSRRSHFGQIWAAAWAHYFGFGQVRSYSGGTEATAFNPRAVAAAQRAGFQIENLGGSNPHYLVYFADDQPPAVCFSKKFSDPYNPTSGFIAVMTCAQADESCPIVPGACARISLPFEDPKVADNTPEEASRYDERCAQIAAELYFAFSQAAKISVSR